MALAESLAANHVDVTLVDRDWTVVQSLSQSPIRAVFGDATSREVLVNAGFKDMDVAVVSISSSMESSVLATLNCRDIGVKQVISKAESDLHGRVLERIGADSVIYPDRDRALRLAKTLTSKKGVVDFLEVTDGYSIAEVAVPKPLVGKTVIEGNVRREYSITVLAIRRVKDDNSGLRDMIISSGTERLREDDLLIVFGPDKNIDALNA